MFFNNFIEGIAFHFTELSVDIVAGISDILGHSPLTRDSRDMATSKCSILIPTGDVCDAQSLFYTIIYLLCKSNVPNMPLKIFIQ